MNFFSYIKEAFGTLTQNKMRSLLSLLGIVIGISSVVILTAIGNGMKAEIIKDMGSANNLITIRSGKISNGNPFVQPPTSSANNSYAEGENEPSIEQKIAAERIFSRETVKLLEEVFGDRVKAIVPSMNFQSNSSPIIAGEESYSSVKVVENSFFHARDIRTERWTLFTDHQVEKYENVAIISADLVESFKGRDPIGKTIYINNSAFTVTGILPKTNDYTLGSAIYIPLTTATKRFGSQKIDNIEVYTHRTEDIEPLQKDLWYFLMKYSGAYSPTELNFHLFTNKKFIESSMAMINNLALFISGIAGISLLVGGIGIMNIMLVSVTERTREIGIRKAIGARRRDIIFQFLTESAILSLVGGIVAIIFSYGIGRLIHAIIPKINPLFSLDIILIATGFSVAMGVIFGLLPAWKAARMQAIDALRFE